MLFIILVLIFLIVYAFLLFRKDKNSRKYSQIFLISLIISILFNFGLLENYIFSLMPYPINDGITIVSRVAYFIIGDEGWSTELYKRVYDISTIISYSLLGIYMLVLLLEKKKVQK